jgi:hypothetical protein
MTLKSKVQTTPTFSKQERPSQNDVFNASSLSQDGVQIWRSTASADQLIHFDFCSFWGLLA